MAQAKLKLAKRYIKFLEICTDSVTIKHVIRSAPEKVIKILCNAAFNIYCGDISLSNSEKNLFSKSRKLIQLLGDLEIPLEQKRRILSRVRKTSIFSAIISTIIKNFGEKVFK